MPTYEAAAAHPLRAPVLAVLAIWFGLVAATGAQGAFVTPDGVPPWRIGVAVVAPILLFLLAFRWWSAFREFMLALDPRFVMGIQAWRFAGFGFVALYAYHVLPGLFALPAGLGDMAIGLSAPWMLMALHRHPEFVRSRALARWNVFGLLDLVVAVGTGILSQMLVHTHPEIISSRPMTELPLAFIPAFLVPLFAMLHLTALSRTSRRRASPCTAETRTS